MDFTSQAVDETLDWAECNDLLDDRAFARIWINDRLQNNPKGRSGLYKELLDHGVPRSVAREVLEEKFSQVDERAICEDLIHERLPYYQDDDLKRKYRKTANYLTRRGFSKGLVHKILKEILFDD